MRRVVEALLSWLDQGGRWERKELVEVGAAGLCSPGQQEARLCCAAYTAVHAFYGIVTCSSLPVTPQGLLALVRRSCGELTFPLTSALMRHAALPGLNPQQRAIVVRAAVEQVGRGHGKEEEPGDHAIIACSPSELYQLHGHLPSSTLQMPCLCFILPCRMWCTACQPSTLLHWSFLVLWPPQAQLQIYSQRWMPQWQAWPNR